MRDQMLRLGGIGSRVKRLATLALIGFMPFAALDARADVVCASLLADDVALVNYEFDTGSRVVRNRASEVPQTSDFRDRLAAAAMLRGVSLGAPNVAASSIALSGADVARYRTIVLSGNAAADKDAVAQIGRLASTVARQAGATQVLLAVKDEFRDWESGARLQGLGLYAKSGQTLARDTYIAPFIGAALLLMRADGSLEARRDIGAHRTYSPPLERPEVRNAPWEILTEPEQNHALNDLMVAEIVEASKSIAAQMAAPAATAPGK